MGSKNLIIVFIWTFVLVSVLVLSWEGYGMAFVGYMIFFIIALASSLAVEAMIPGTKLTGSELERGLQEIRARLDELDRESH